MLMPYTTKLEVKKSQNSMGVPIGELSSLSIKVYGYVTMFFCLFHDFCDLLGQPSLPKWGVLLGRALDKKEYFMIRENRSHVSECHLSD